MILIEDIYRALGTFRYPPDNEQSKVVEKTADGALFIVAGPGSGKTTCLTLRILKLVLVDQLPPRSILTTTFTVKAAQELRSRILGWGFRIIDALKADPKIGKEDKERLENIDINQVWTGTLDSLCEQLLRDYRAPGTQPPVLADDFVAKTLLLRQGIFNDRRDQDPDLDSLLLSIHSDANNQFGFHIGSKVGLMQSIWDRRFQDLVDWNDFLNNGSAEIIKSRQVLDAGLSDYARALSERGMVDFALLEYEVLERLRKGQLTEFTQDLQVVLVDEYQDTNLLQEQIYLELATACKGALCVVGDDDQSLYRFRGATVDLFSNFIERYKGRFRREPDQIYLSVNYRSTQTIVNFVNNYAKLDAYYQTVRVSGKPALNHGSRADRGQPILAMFRDTREQLAADLATFIHAVFRGGGFATAGIDPIIRDSLRGDVGDCALLCSSPEEYSSSGEARLPRLLRDQLLNKTPGITVFNPRGEDFAGIRIVSIFGGLLAECLDPGGRTQDTISGLSRDTIDTLNQWRQVAIDYASGEDASKELIEYAEGWLDRDPKRSGFEWPRSVAIIDLIYGLVHYFPELHDDPEGQVYLEVFTRQLGACEQIGKFKGRLVHDPSNPGLSEASVKELLRDFLSPIASGTVQIDEELIDAFPRDRLSILSIHQSKGLEFPITIVDVGSDFKSNHAAHAFKRYPKTGGPSHRLEDLLRPHTPLGKEKRLQVDRAFDDLYRQYFVAFSRPQDVLLLVGIRPTFPGGRVINVATGWQRSGACNWQGSNLPFLEI
jgi:DNA helicase-2/ATP-dependent DNA helicase PcrA